MHSTVSQLRSSRVVREHEFVAMPPTADPVRLPAVGSLAAFDASLSASCVDRIEACKACGTIRVTAHHVFEDLGRRDVHVGRTLDTWVNGSAAHLGSAGCARDAEDAGVSGDPWPVSDVGGVDTVGTQPRNRASASPHWGSCGSWLPSTAARRVAMILRAMMRLVMSVRGSPALYGQEARATQQRRATAWR